MPDKQINILLAEDDLNLGVLLVDYLESAGYNVKLCRNGELAVLAFERSHFDLCLLDVMLPKKDGFSVAKTIRESNSQVPILFLTAKSLKEDKLKGYESGADDYITKPFDEEELLWKINALIRRLPAKRETSTTEIAIIGKYFFDFKNQSLNLNGKTKRITEKESEILHYLFTHRNQVIKRPHLVKSLWGADDYFAGRSLDVFITKIRKYLNEDPQLTIENVFGVGFIFNVPE